MASANNYLQVKVDDKDIELRNKGDDSLIQSHRRPFLYASQEKLIKKKEEYVQSFTVHGLTKICTGTKPESFFWLFMLLLGLILSVFVVYRLVSRYLQFDIYTEITQVVTTKNYFPAITFCYYSSLMTAYFSYCGHYASDLHIDKKKYCDYSEKVVKSHLKNTTTDGQTWSNGFYNVLRCSTWGNQDCLNNKFLHSASKLDHACFTWNYNGNFHDAYSHADLQFEVNSTFIKRSFIVALVHDPAVKELDMTNRVILEPSKTYQLRISKTVVKRLPSPYPSNCTAGKPNDIFTGKYTRRTCLESISYMNMFKTCGGVPDYHREFIPQDVYKMYQRNNSISETLSCIREFSKTEVEMTDDCPFPCEEIELQTTASFHEMEGKKDGNRSVYRVEVQYQNVDSYRLIEEKMLFSWDQVIGEVGGLLGLVIGASVISVIEILAYLFLCCVQKCEKYFEKS